VADASWSAAALRSRAAGGRLGPAHGEKEVPASVLHPGRPRPHLHQLIPRGRRRKQPSRVPGASGPRRRRTLPVPPRSNFVHWGRDRLESGTRRIWRSATVPPSGPAEGKARGTLGRHLQREGAAAKGDERGGGRHALDGGSSPDPPTSRLPRSGVGGEGIPLVLGW
jgi:hypothetical protein